MKIILIDDEPLILEELSYLCEKHKDIEICGKFVNPKQALQYVAGHPVDFAFCDIRMPGITGLELLDQMHKEKPDLQAAFVIAYDQYAFDAYQLDACDYLLKPVDPDETEAAIRRAIRDCCPADVGIKWTNDLVIGKRKVCGILTELAAEAGATEALKARDPMKWVGLMNTCKAQAEEILLAELINS